MITLREAIHEFISRGLGGTSKSKVPVKNLLLGKDEGKAIGDDKEPSVLIYREEISRCLDLPIDDEEVFESLQHAIKESVKSYTSSKATAIEAYKKFLDFMNIKYKVRFPMEFPPVFSSEFDRQMFIVKELHEKGRGVEYLENRLWISSRTLEDDLKKLQTEGEIIVLGQEVAIKGIVRENGVIGFQSTVHPLFLTPNLTQVVVILNGLQVMAKNESYKDYAEYLAATIWKELSEYGKQRILTVSEILSLDKLWYEKISQTESGSLFRTERECSNEEGSKNIVYFAKSGEDCSIAYTDDEGGEQVMLDVRIITSETEDGDVRVKKNGKISLIKKSSIRKCARDSNRLF